MDLGEVGYFSRTHGLKGHLILKQNNSILSPTVKAVFVEINGSKAPYFITEVKGSGNNMVLGLEGIETLEQAKPLIGKKILAELKYIEEGLTTNIWLGYEVIDRAKGSLGTVEAVSDNGQQIILSLKYNSKELLLPLVEDFIKKLDEKGKKIHYEAPEGLIDLYL